MSQHRGAIVKDEPQVLTPAIYGSKLTTRQGRLEKRSVLESTAGAKPRVSTTSTLSTTTGTTNCSSPARTVSTSGSSGTCVRAWHQRGDSTAGRTLLRFFLVVAGVGGM